MSLSKYCIVGDSNVKRFVTITNRRACPELSTCQVLNCGKLPVFVPTLEEVRDDVEVCILSCLTNFVTSAPESTSTSVRVEAVLLEVFDAVNAACLDHPHRLYMVCPPMYRSAPLWYRDGLADVLVKFSSIFSSPDRATNLRLLQSFSSPTFEADGTHLTASSGLEYLFHLFDAAKTAISKSDLDTPTLVSRGGESTRLLEDRMMAIEQDHRRLNTSFELSTAVTAEREDFQENVRNEVFFMISGLSRIEGLSGKEWMDKAISDVQEVIKKLLDKELKIIVVHNASGRAPGSEVRYSVKMETAAASQEIRHKFGSFFIGGQDRRPAELKGISISSKVTPGTQIRIMILKLLGRKYLASNKDSKVKVVGYEPRPLLKITPPETSSSKRVKIFNFIEAISKLPTHFTAAEMSPIVTRARIHFKDRIRSTFIVISDDMSSAEPRSAQDQAEVVQEVVQDHDEPGQGQGHGQGQGRKRGHPDSTRTTSGSQRARIN